MPMYKSAQPPAKWLSTPGLFVRLLPRAFWIHIPLARAPHLRALHEAVADALELTPRGRSCIDLWWCADPGRAPGDDEVRAAIQGDPLWDRKKPLPEKLAAGAYIVGRLNFGNLGFWDTTDVLSAEGWRLYLRGDTVEAPPGLDVCWIPTVQGGDSQDVEGQAEGDVERAPLIPGLSSETIRGSLEDFIGASSEPAKDKRD